MIYVLLAILAALHVADIWTTQRILAAGGVEHNPLARWLMARIGVIPAALLLKAVGMSLAVAVVVLYPTEWWVIAALCALYVAVVLHNLDSV